MSAPKPKPYEWKRTRGVLPAWLVRDYATWLFPQLGLKWEAKGVTDFSRRNEGSQLSVKPYQFPRSTGLMRIRELRQLAAYVFASIGKLADKKPYQWPRVTGIALVSDMINLAGHFENLLNQKRKQSS
jgi:homoserine dehydrogenase